MKALLLAVMTFALATPAAVTAAEQLYAVPLEDGAALAAVEDLGGVVRHIGIAEMIVEGNEGLAEGLGDRGREARRLLDARTVAPLYLSYPRYSVERLASVGDVVWWEPDGAVLVACAPELVEQLRSLSFASYELPGSVNVGSWFDNTPPEHVALRTRQDELAMRGVVTDVINSISPDSLMAHVLALSEHPGGESRSRFVYREECLTEAKPYIIDRLNDYLPARALIDTQRFVLDGYTCEEGVAGPIVGYPADNIIGVLPGNGRSSGCYVICAHYDAIAGSTPDSLLPYPVTEPPWYWWCENPAPGADDNATGVAVVLEAARALSGLTFPFDIRFILLSGEELGLHGSTTYADSVAGYRAGHDEPVAPPDTIFGVFNVDMIAYKRESGDPDTCDIVTNPGSTWLADWIVDTAESLYDSLFPGFHARRIDMALAYSDHAPFWARDYDATAALEHWNPRERNPNYHTIFDTPATVYPSQFASTARMVIGAVARLADPDGQFNLAVFPDDVVFYATTGDGLEYHTDHYVWGETARVRVDFHAFGPDGSADVTLEVWDGDPDVGRLLSSASFDGAMGGGEAFSHEFEWELDEADFGDHPISARLVVTGDPESSLSDNVVTDVLLRVDAPGLFIAEHFPWPNPVTDTGEFNLSYRLSRGTEGGVEIQVFDLLGQSVAEKSLPYDQASANEGLLPGLNTIAWTTIDSDGANLSSGVYIYRITLYDRGSVDPIDEKTGKFAVTR